MVRVRITLEVDVNSGTAAFDREAFNNEVLVMAKSNFGSLIYLSTEVLANSTNHLYVQKEPRK